MVPGGIEFRGRGGLPPPGIRGVAGDPGDKISDDRGLKLPLGRHLELLVAQGPDQEARIRVPGNDRRTALASGKQTLAAVEQELASYLLRSLRMTFVAALDEHRPDLLLKEVDVFDIRIPG